jgi:ankyrin repeat protein
LKQYGSAIIHELIDSCNNDKFTPLMLACMRGYKYPSDKSKAPDQRLQSVKALLKMGADADYCPKSTMMGCLHWAAY